MLVEMLSVVMMFGGWLMGMGEEFGFVWENYFVDLLLIDGNLLVDICIL